MNLRLARFEDYFCYYYLLLNYIDFFQPFIPKMLNIININIKILNIYIKLIFILILNLSSIVNLILNLFLY